MLSVRDGHARIADCTDYVQSGPVLDQAEQVAEITTSRLGLLQLQQLGPVPRNVHQARVNGDEPRKKGRSSKRDDQEINKTRQHKPQASGGGSRKHDKSSVPGQTYHCSAPASSCGLTANNNNNSCGPGGPILPTYPTTSGANDQLILGPDQIDMLLALAVSNCTGGDMVGCCKVALQSSHVGNIIRNYLVAVKYCLYDVMDKMIHIIRRNFLCISRSQEFLLLPLEYILLFMEDSYLNVQNELDMFVTALLWIDYNKQERMAYSGCVLKCVRYAYIHPADIVRYVEPNRHLFTGQDGAEALVNLYKHHVFSQEGQESSGCGTMIPPRRGMSGVPARAYIVSGAPSMQGPVGCGIQLSAGGAQPASQTPCQPCEKLQKGRVTFAPDTLFPPGDIPPESKTQLGTAACAPSAGETPPPVGTSQPAVGVTPSAGTGSTPVVSTSVVPDAQVAPVGASAMPDAQEASVSTPEITSASASPVSTPEVSSATASPVSTSSVSDAPASPASTLAVPDAPVSSASNILDATGNAVENVQDKSNNSRLCGDLYDRWICGDSSLSAWRAGLYQEMAPCHSIIKARSNCPPGRTSHDCSMVANACRDHLMRSGYGHQVRALAPFQVTDSGSGQRVLSQFDVRGSNATGRINGQDVAYLKTDDSREKPKSLDKVGSWSQQLSGQQPHHGQQNSKLSQQQPHHGQQYSKLSGQQPHHGQQNSKLSGQEPHHGQQYSKLSGQQPHHGQKNSKLSQQQPHHGQQNAKLSGQQPHHGQQNSKLSGQQPHHGQQNSKLSLQQPHHGQQNSKLSLQQPHHGQQNSKLSLQQPHHGQQNSKLSLQQPHHGQQNAKLSGQQPHHGQQNLKLSGQQPHHGQQNQQLSGQHSVYGQQNQQLVEQHSVYGHQNQQLAGQHYVYGQPNQQLVGQQSHHGQVYVITRSVTGPVISIAYPGSGRPETVVK